MLEHCVLHISYIKRKKCYNFRAVLNVCNKKHCNSQRQKLEFPIYKYAHGWNTRCCALEWSLRSHGDDDKQAGLKLSQITRRPQITLVVKCHRSTSN